MPLRLNELLKQELTEDAEEQDCLSGESFEALHFPSLFALWLPFNLNGWGGGPRPKNPKGQVFDLAFQTENKL